MQGRLQRLRVVDPVLTKLATGYKNTQFISSVLFPTASMQKEAGIIPVFGKEAFRVYDTKRALRAASNVMPVDDLSTITVALDEHDLVYPIDTREQNEAYFDQKAKGIKRAKDAVELEKEIEAANLAQDINTYASDSKVTLAAADQWSASTGDPIEVIEAAKDVMRSKIGMRPNTIVMGHVVYSALKYCKALQEALGANERKVITLDILKDLFGIRNIVVGETLKSINADDELDDIWGNNLILAYVAQSDGGADYETPSFGYTLQKTGYPQADTYDTVGGKVFNCRYTDIYKTVVVGQEAGYLVKDCAKVEATGG